MKYNLRALVLSVALTSSTAFAQTTTIDFDKETLGQPPAGFSFALTGRGKPGNWIVKKDEASADHGNILAQTDADPTDYRFPVCVFDGVTARDVDVSVEFKPISGKGDQGAHDEEADVYAIHSKVEADPECLHPGDFLYELVVGQAGLEFAEEHKRQNKGRQSCSERQQADKEPVIPGNQHQH